jgi:hypothetical protein
MAIFTEATNYVTSERSVVAGAETYDSWLTRQVQEALADDRPSMAHCDVVAEWEIERAALLKRVGALPRTSPAKAKRRRITSVRF